MHSPRHGQQLAEQQKYALSSCKHRQLRTATATAPGGAAVLRIAPGPWGDILAVASQAGLHCLELFDFGAPMADITPGPLARPFSDIVFNSVTHDLYAGSSNGSVQVFSRLA